MVDHSWSLAANLVYWGANIDICLYAELHPDTGKHQLYPVTWRSVLSSQPEGTGICIFRTGQNTLIKATSAFPTDTDALYCEILNSCSTLQTQPR